MIDKPRIKLTPDNLRLLTSQVICANRVKALETTVVKAQPLITQVMNLQPMSHHAKNKLQQAFSLLDHAISQRCTPSS